MTPSKQRRKALRAALRRERIATWRRNGVVIPCWKFPCAKQAQYFYFFGRSWCEEHAPISVLMMEGWKPSATTPKP